MLHATLVLEKRYDELIIGTKHTHTDAPRPAVRKVSPLVEHELARAR